MNQIATQAIVLGRINYGEADRILTLLTPDNGKIGVIAKGVRKSKSKLAGGIELFSISSVSFIKGRSELHTLISTRLVKNFADISKDLERSDVGYVMLKLTNKVTSDNPDSGYFQLLEHGLQSLDNLAIPPQTAELWFYAHLLQHEGHNPQLQTSTNGEKLAVGSSYEFNLADMAFESHPDGQYGSGHIKLLRLAKQLSADKLAQVSGAENEIKATLQLLRSVIRYYYNQ